MRVEWWAVFGEGEGRPEHRGQGCTRLGLLCDFMKDSALGGLTLRIGAGERVPEELGLLFRWQLYSTSLGNSTRGPSATASLWETVWLVFVNHSPATILKAQPGSIVTCFIC